MELRVIDELGSPQRGSWNMALDEALLESARLPAARATLRFYGWERPTLSLGYFQSSADVPPKLQHVDLVRRSTGGGAILHDRELTYSIVLPPGRWPCADIRTLVRHVHGIVAESCRVAEPLGLHPGRPKLAEEPFLCFQRRSDGDLVGGAHKVLGSAQRNRQGALLQHGSILMHASVHTPQLLGLAELGATRADGAPIAPASLAQLLAECLVATWGAMPSVETPDAHESETAHRIEQEKFANPAWTHRR